MLITERVGYRGEKLLRILCGISESRCRFGKESSRISRAWLENATPDVIRRVGFMVRDFLYIAQIASHWISLTSASISFEYQPCGIFAMRDSNREGRCDIKTRVKVSESIERSATKVILRRDDFDPRYTAVIFSYGKIVSISTVEVYSPELCYRDGF